MNLITDKRRLSIYINIDFHKAEEHLCGCCVSTVSLVHLEGKNPISFLQNIILMLRNTFFCAMYYIRDKT